jgi:hypothetical protein
MTEIKSNLQKNKEYDELDRFLKLPFSLPQCHQNNKNAHKRKVDTNATFTCRFKESTLGTRTSPSTALIHVDSHDGGW